MDEQGGEREREKERNASYKKKNSYTHFGELSFTFLFTLSYIERGL